jgi:hypothetical protein
VLPRPFRTDLDPTLLPYDGDLQVIVRFHPSVSLTAELREALDRPFRDLATAGAWGAMAGERHAPATSSMQLLTAAEPTGGNERLWTLATRNIDRGALLVIENVVHFLHMHVARVVALRIHSPSFGASPVVPAQLPADYEPRPFEVEYNMENVQVLVDVDFHDRHDPASLEPFRRAWTAWEGLAIQGGFADATTRPEVVSLAVEDELRVTSTGLSGAFDDVNISDAGFYCLVNMLATLHHRLAPISSVTIE